VVIITQGAAEGRNFYLYRFTKIPMKRALQFLVGYLFGIALFFILIPYGFLKLSQLDFLFNYRMIVGSMVVRFALSGVLLLIGTFFLLWSNLYLFQIGKGGPAEGMGVALSPRTKKLVISGPYKYCRNPMVFGALTVYLALVIYLNSISGLISLMFLLCGAIFYLKYSEEKRLLRDFGSDYIQYRKKVPMIIPLRQQTRNI
jgi:protein-S-isoprenylcysteine O-methyltransferase Ste14